MKQIVIILLSFLFLFSCTKEEIIAPTSIAGLKLEKEKQEHIKDSISSIILQIESKISDLDTIKKLQLVRVLSLIPSDFEHYIALHGNTKTNKNIIIRPQASGLITAVYVKEGQRVRTGQAIFQLDNSVLKNQIFEVKNQLGLAQTSFDRQKRLWNQKIGSEMQYLQAKNNKESLENNIKTLNSQLKNYRVTAPFNGIIDDLIANKGDLASPQTALARIVNLTNMYVESDVSENYLTSIKKGSTAIINFASINKTIHTKISQVGNNISPDNRSFKIRIDIKNENEIIKPNLLSDIKIRDFSATKAIVIPSNLVQIDGDGNTFVFTITKDSIKNIVTKKKIVVANNYEGKSIISKGLKQNDILITEGSRNVSSEQEVELLENSK